MPAEPGGDLPRSALEQARTQARRRGAAVRALRRAGRQRPPEERSGPGPDPRDPQLLGAGIHHLVEERSWDDPLRDATVMGCWDRLVGAELAAHCRPERLCDGELALVAESTAWATQVRLLAGTVLARLADELGPGVVRRLRVRGPTGPDWRRGPRRVAGRGPRDTYG